MPKGCGQIRNTERKFWNITEDIMREETRKAASEAARKLSEEQVPYLFLYGDVNKDVDIIAHIEGNGQEIGDLLASMAKYDSGFAEVIKTIAKLL